MRQHCCKTLPQSHCGYGAVKLQECQDHGWSRTGREGEGGEEEQKAEARAWRRGSCYLAELHWQEAPGPAPKPGPSYHMCIQWCCAYLVLASEASDGSCQDGAGGLGRDGQQSGDLEKTPWMPRIPTSLPQRTPQAVAVAFKMGLVLNFIVLPQRLT